MPIADAMFKLIATVKQGIINSPLTSAKYATLEEARAAAKELFRDDRVLKVMIVVSDIPPRFAEWVEK